MPSYSYQIILLADIGEVIGAIVGLIALVFWVIQRIVEASKEAAPRGRPAGAQPQPAAGQGGARPAGQQADPLRNQVEEFLRRAGRGPQAADQGGQPQRRLPPAAHEIEVLIDEETSPSERRPVGAPLRPMEARPVAARPRVAATPAILAPSDKRPPRRSVVPRKRKTLAERATERAAARAETISKQVSHLGQRIIEDDQQFDVQLQAKFDHTVGTLTGSAVTAAEQAAVVASSASTPAAQIAAMLASPDGVRQAIVVNEILRRPTDRW